MAYKNFWSLNTDEAIASGLLRDHLSKDIEVLMPMNAQMKDVDLVLMNFKSKKTITIQVKGSRAFEPSKKDLKRFGYGSNGWFFLDKKTIFNATADYFIFLVYVIEENMKVGRRSLNPHLIIIPTDILKKLTMKYKKVHGERYSYYFWVNPKTKESFDFRDIIFPVGEYLDKAGYSNLNI